MFFIIVSMLFLKFQLAAVILHIGQGPGDNFVYKKFRCTHSTWPSKAIKDAYFSFCWHF